MFPGGRRDPRDSVDPLPSLSRQVAPLSVVRQQFEDTFRERSGVARSKQQATAGASQDFGIRPVIGLDHRTPFARASRIESPFGSR